MTLPIWTQEDVDIVKKQILQARCANGKEIEQFLLDTYNITLNTFRKRRERLEGTGGYADLCNYTTPRDIIAQENMTAGSTYSSDVMRVFLKLQELSREMEPISSTTVSINEDDWFALLFTGDWHLEHIWAQTAQLEKDLQLLRDCPHVYVVYCGDGVDFHSIALTHLGGEHEVLLSPKLSRLLHTYLISLIKDRLIAAVLGNHEEWQIRVADYDHLQDIMRSYSIAYLGSGGTLHLKINEYELECYIYHKLQGSSIYNDLHPCMRVIRTGNIEGNPDIIAGAHGHANAIGSEIFRGKRRFYIRTSSYLERSRWAQGRGYPSSVVGLCPWIALHPENKENFFMGQGVSGLVDTINNQRALD